MVIQQGGTVHVHVHPGTHIHTYTCIHVHIYHVLVHAYVHVYKKMHVCALYWGLLCFPKVPIAKATELYMHYTQSVVSKYFQLQLASQRSSHGVCRGHTCLAARLTGTHSWGFLSYCFYTKQVGYHEPSFQSIHPSIKCSL